MFLDTKQKVRITESSQYWVESQYTGNYLIKTRSNILGKWRHYTYLLRNWSFYSSIF